ncbi:hypothetical protein K1T71_014627 [Dendrolimus kikuchii]|uniref:Uncharacterized protein n=1 Tax=Dendrolimus kikuchii TaxID=765133 RepID=A0ACC1CEP5_9NEOP|nr:hypothetical protein K1T71_014627 [Dendrolimus kikuchii]
MEAQFANVVDITNINICRCCLKNHCYKDISTEYYQCGEKEVYEDMLKDTFDVQIQHETRNGATSRRLICDDCISKLREAYTFKKMVMDNEARFQQYLDGLSFDESKFKSLVPSDFEMYNPDDSFEDNEVLANIKEEATKTNIKIKKKRKVSETRRKFSRNSSNPNAKIWDRSSKTRILRENSLKLLANSSICVFQWNKSRYRCFCCSEPFDDMNLLKEHTYTEHSLTDIERKMIKQQNLLVKVEISLLKCKICDKNLSDLDNLKNHLHNAHNVEFPSLEHLFVPFKIQDGGLTCQICYENFKLFRVLNIHMNKHYQKHICDKCGAGFSSLIFLNLHRTRLHRPFKCGRCKLDFKNKVDRKNHEIKAHNIQHERKKRFPCPFCDERFFQESAKVQHLVQKHDFEKPEFKCEFCSKSFITKSLVNNHTKYAHLKEKSHECDLCHSYFYSRSDLGRHKGTHVDGKKFSCNTCSSLFSSKESLRRHIKRSHL